MRGTDHQDPEDARIVGETEMSSDETGTGVITPTEDDGPDNYTTLVGHAPEAVVSRMNDLAILDALRDEVESSQEFGRPQMARWCTTQ